MERTKIYVCFVLILSMMGCSSPNEVAPLDENISFENIEDDLDDIDFSTDSSEDTGDEEFSFDEDSNSSDELSFDDFDSGTDSEKTDEVAVLDESDDLSFDDSDDLSLEDAENLDFEDVDSSGGELSFDDFEESAGEALDFDEEVGEGSVLADDNVDFDDFGAEENGFSSGEEDVFASEDNAETFDTPQSQTGVLLGTEEGLSSEETGPNQVLSIDYNSNRAGGAFIIKTAQNPDVQTEYIPETHQYILKIKNSKIGKSLARPFLTKDFRQSFKEMNSYQDAEGNSKFIFKLKEDSYPKMTKIDNGLILEPGLLSSSKLSTQVGVTNNKIPLSGTDLEDFLLETNEYVGEPISIQAKDEDIVTVINFISEQVGANLIVSDAVKGKISIKLKEIPWDQALVTIMKTKSLGYIRNGNILRVAPLEELKKEALLAAEIKKSKQSLAPFYVKVFPLSYAKPSVISEKVTPFLTPGSANQAGGKVISEERSSSLIVRDSLDVIENVASLIKELDRPPLQVMIQAKIIEAQKNFSKTFEKTFNIRPSSTQGSGTLGFNNPVNFSGENGLSSTLQISGLSFLGNLGHRLRLSEIDSKIKILSSPNVMAINNVKASILQSDQVLNSAVVTDQTGQRTTTVERIDAELQLEVTPQVSSDGNVIMDVFIKREFPGEDILGTSAISKREAKTKVIVGNNRTAMIGGVYQTTETKTERGTPVLRKVPLLKWFFNDKSYRKNDTELIIFLTPRVIKQLPAKSLVKGNINDAEDKVSKF